MIKKLACLTTLTALTAFPLLAAADYKLYGRVQAEFNGEGVSGVSAPADGIGVDDDALSSYWGIKGQEKISDNLAVFTKLEFNIDPADNNAEANWEQYIGIQGGFGSIALGRQQSPYKYHGGVSYDPFYGTHLQARRAGGMSGNANGFGHDGFVSNAIVYKSPEIFGASVDIMLMPDETSAGTDGDMDYSIGVDYKMGPMQAIVAHNRLNTAAGQPDEIMTKLGGKLEMELFGLKHIFAGQFEWIENSTAGTGNNAGTATGASFFGPYSGIGTCPAVTTGAVCADGRLNGGVDGTIWFAGYQMKLGNFNIAVEFGHTESENNPGEEGNEVEFWAAGLIYNFSKHFSMFTGWSESDTNLDYLGSDAVRVTGSDRDVWTIGMRKDF